MTGSKDKKTILLVDDAPANIEVARDVSEAKPRQGSADRPGDDVASGLDPDISPAAAFYQIPRVAAARNLSKNAVERLVQAHIQGRQFGVLGEPLVNVLELNLALDGLSDTK